MTKIICIVAGGTAGHVFPAQALSEILGTKNEILFVTDNRGAKYFDDQSKVEKLQISNLTGNILRKGLAFFKLGFSTLKCFYLLKTRKVKLAIGFGGLTSFPVLFAAKYLKIPIILHEQNAILGQANRFFLKDAELLAMSYKGANLKSSLGFIMSPSELLGRGFAMCTVPNSDCTFGGYAIHLIHKVSQQGH